MSKITSLLKILLSVVLGNTMKIKANIELMWLRRFSLSEIVSKGVIVSLTSYGQRVANNSVSYTLYSLLKQRVRPEKVVLWLDEEEYNDNTLPKMLRRIKDWGVDIKYCSNMRSYKKILPSLKTFPDYDIITADDDLYYTPTWLEELIHTRDKHPQCIITQTLRFPKLTAEKQFAPYREWTMNHHLLENDSYSKILAMPLGGYGTLYPAHCFDDEVLNYELISAICPFADDLWLYVMGLRLRLAKENVRNAKSSVYQLDLIRQKFSRDRLYAKNVGEDMNDVQLRQLLTHYNISPAELL